MTLKDETEEKPTDDLTQVGEPIPDVVRKLLHLTGPTILGSMLAFSTQAITNSFVGRRLGPVLFAHYTLGVSVANLFGFSIGMGLTGALETFISQAYGRDRQTTKDIGILIQRAIFLSIICTVPLTCLFLWGGPIFRFVFGEDLGNGALEFTRHAVPNLILTFIREVLTDTLQSINLPALVLYSTIASAVTCLTFNYFYTTSIASAVAVLTATQVVQLVVLIGLTRWHPSVTFWHYCEWPSKEAYNIRGMIQFLKIGIPCLVAMCAEWWAFEVLDVVAASISLQTVAIVNLVITIGAMYFSIGLAISVACSVLVGNALGENRPVLARQYAWTGIALCQCMNVFNATFLVLIKHSIARIFTQDAEMEETFCNMILIIAVYICGDSTQFCLQSIYKGVGEQSDAAKIVLLSLWAIGLPMTIMLGKWREWGGPGVMMGLLSGFTVEIPLLIFNFLRWDWDALALEASKPLDERDDELLGESKSSKVSDSIGLLAPCSLSATASLAADGYGSCVRVAEAKEEYKSSAIHDSDTEVLMSRHASAEMVSNAACGAAVHMISTPSLSFRGRPKELPHFQPLEEDATSEISTEMSRK